MSTKNFVSNGDAETLFTGIGNKLSTLKSGLNDVNSNLTSINDAVKLNTQDLTTPSRTANIVISTFSDSTDVSQYSVALYINCDLKPDTTYTLSFDGTNSAKYYANENLFANQPSVTVGSERVVLTVTTKSSIPKTGSTFISGKGWIILKNSITEPAGHTFTDVQFEIGSSATPYSTYTSSVNARLKTVENGGDILGTYRIIGIFQSSALYNQSYGVAFLGGFDPNKHTVTINSAKTLSGTSVTLVYNQYTTYKGCIGFYEATTDLLGQIVDINVTISLTH